MSRLRPYALNALLSAGLLSALWLLLLSPPVQLLASRLALKAINRHGD
ncbi:MAG: hypothetical protein ACKVJG_14325 [Candidatus Latescibacterota bacterium]